MSNNNRRYKGIIWCSIIRVRGIAVGLIPEKANIAKITRDLEVALEQFYASLPDTYKTL